MDIESFGIVKVEEKASVESEALGIGWKNTIGMYIIDGFGNVDLSGGGVVGDFDG